MINKRKVETFSAGCGVCMDAIEIVKRAGLGIEHHLQEARSTLRLGFRSMKVVHWPNLWAVNGGGS